MNTFKEKFKLLYVPFLIIAPAFILSYTFLHWLLFIHWQVFAVKDDIVNIIMPLLLSWIPVIGWYRVRTKVIRYGYRYRDGFVFQLLIWAAIAVPSIFAQNYLVATTGKLTQLNKIETITTAPATDYYTVSQVHIDTGHVHVYGSSRVAGLNDESFELFLYMAIPMRNSVGDTVSGGVPAWLGVKYTKSVSNSLNAVEKRKMWDRFSEESKLDFERRDISKFAYLKQATGTKDMAGYERAIMLKDAPVSAKHLILLPVYEPFEQRNNLSFLGFVGSLVIGGLLLFFLLFFITLDYWDYIRYKEGYAIETEHELNFLFSFFVPKGKFFVTPILMDINILVFLGMVVSGLGFSDFHTFDLVQWGANYRPLTQGGGEWWRLLTSVFLHGGVVHLVSNMVGLVFIGALVEPIMGRARFALVYIVSGLLASCASLWWHEATVSVGASGAIFGLYGVFVALLIAGVFPKDIRKQFLRMTLVFIAYNVAMGFTGNIDNAAHLGGLITGIISGFILAKGLKIARNRRHEEPVINSW